MKAPIKAWEDLDITDDFIFSKFMQDKTICKEVLELLLLFEVEDIEYVEYQKSIDIMHDAKGISLDVYVKGEDKVYNVEMQVGKSRELARRCRFYESAIDFDMLEKGAMYKDLKDSFVIFICTFDAFGKGLPCYTLKNTCQEDKNLNLNDGRHVLFFNTKAYLKEKNTHRRNFLAFVNGSEVQDSKIATFSKQIESIKTNEKWRIDYMNLALKFQDVREEGFEEGWSEGKLEGKLEGILEGKLEGKLEGTLHVARNLLNILDDVAISQTTGLSLEEVKKLRLENE